MTNIALHKKIEEKMKRPDCSVDGQIDDYTANNGFAEFQWPGTLTIDLDEPDNICCIRILLWDGLGQGDGQPDDRIYKYRLSTSLDHQTWNVFFDTGDNGYNGWQVFRFKQKIKARYIRLHGLFNSKNQHIQVVQIEAHDSEPRELDREASITKEIGLDSTTEEVGDGLPLESNVRNIINSLEQLIDSYEILNPEPFKNLIFQLHQQVQDVSAIERSMASVRREITEPVKKELKKSAKLGRFSVWGFFVGIIGFIFAILSLLNNLFPIVKSKTDQELVQRVESIYQNSKDMLNNIQTKKEPQSNISSYSYSPFSPFSSEYIAEVTEGEFVKVGNALWVEVTKINSDGSADIIVRTTSGSGHNPSAKSGDYLSFGSLSIEFLPLQQIKVIDVDTNLKTVTFIISNSNF